MKHYQIVKITLVLMVQVLLMKNVRNIRVHAQLLNLRRSVKIYKIAPYIYQQILVKWVLQVFAFGILILKLVQIKLVPQHLIIISITNYVLHI